MGSKNFNEYSNHSNSRKDEVRSLKVTKEQIKLCLAKRQAQINVVFFSMTRYMFDVDE